MGILLQVAGLKYFDDMQQRIPRTEVEQVHGLVYGVVREVLAIEGMPDADRLHCRVTGSYIRGKPMTGSSCCSCCLLVVLHSVLNCSVGVKTIAGQAAKGCQQSQAVQAALCTYTVNSTAACSASNQSAACC